MAPEFISVGRSYLVFPQPSPTSGGNFQVIAIDANNSSWVKVREGSGRQEGEFWINLDTVRQVIEVL